jgi:hypothetical protein
MGKVISQNWRKQMIPFMFIVALLVGIAAPVGLMFMELGGWSSVKVILSLISIVDLVVLTIIITIVGWFGNKIRYWLY